MYVLNLWKKSNFFRYLDNDTPQHIILEVSQEIAHLVLANTDQILKKYKLCRNKHVHDVIDK